MSSKSSYRKVSMKSLKSLGQSISLNKLGKEGEDHINISPYSETFIGRVFSLEYLKTIHYPGIGSFPSVMNLFYWIRSPNLDDNLRNLTGPRLRQYIHETTFPAEYTPNFTAIMGWATWLKVLRYRNHRGGQSGLFAKIKELDLDKIQIVSYRTERSTGLRVAAKNAEMLINITTKIIQAVQNDETPDFKSFCDDTNYMGLFYLEGALNNRIGTEETNAAIERYNEYSLQKDEERRRQREAKKAEREAAKQRAAADTEAHQESEAADVEAVAPETETEVKDSSAETPVVDTAETEPAPAESETEVVVK